MPLVGADSPTALPGGGWKSFRISYIPQDGGGRIKLLKLCARVSIIFYVGRCSGGKEKRSKEYTNMGGGWVGRVVIPGRS